MNASVIVSDTQGRERALFLCLFCHSEEICTLVIAEAFPEDGGLFCCTVSNPYGSMSSTAYLSVAPQPGQRPGGTYLQSLRACAAAAVECEVKPRGCSLSCLHGDKPLGVRAHKTCE